MRRFQVATAAVPGIRAVLCLADGSDTQSSRPVCLVVFHVRTYAWYSNCGGDARVLASNANVGGDVDIVLHVLDASRFPTLAWQCFE